MKDLWHKRLKDFESFDKITFEVVPRYKTSGLSGDEWRQHVQVNFWFKGEVVHEAGFGNMRSALMMVGAEWLRAQEPIPEKVIKLEESGVCDQPSCARMAEGRFLIKRETSQQGDFIEQNTFKNFRRFCKKHLRRGDCSREDSDDNYEPLDGVTAEASTNIEESPSIEDGQAAMIRADLDAKAWINQQEGNDMKRVEVTLEIHRNGLGVPGLHAYISPEKMASEGFNLGTPVVVTRKDDFDHLERQAAWLKSRGITVGVPVIGHAEALDEASRWKANCQTAVSVAQSFSAGLSLSLETNRNLQAQLNEAMELLRGLTKAAPDKKHETYICAECGGGSDSHENGCAGHSA